MLTNIYLLLYIRIFSYIHIYNRFCCIHVLWQLKGLKPMESGTKKRSTKASRDSTKEIDNLMRSDYPSRMKGRKRTPIHN